MKQLAQYQDGRLELQEVPCPVAPPGGVLVRVTHSVISIGTEKMKVEQARMNLLQKARARPDQVRKVIDTARNLGWRSALDKVRNRLQSPSPLGYSVAGEVIEVHPANTRLKVGDRVACGGAECAFHAEYVAVPDLLTAVVPAGVEGWQAAYTTLCSIALQAVRQMAPQLGDRLVVIGQGLVGLLITNLLSISGARVLAVDVVPGRKPFCLAMGAERVVISEEQDLAQAVREWTDGVGVDGALICTSAASNAPIEQAADALRDRGRMVVVGITKVELPWRIFTEKEIEVRYSRSYGPGRYDPAYEWAGADYPVGYVRWTEQRNFEACLKLMACARLNLAAITTRRALFLAALEVYQDIASGSPDIGIVLEYGSSAAAPAATPPPAPSVPAPGIPNGPHPDIPRSGQSTPAARRIASGVSTLDVIGAGNFARTMLLPHLKGRIGFGTVINQTSLSANHVRTKFGFDHAGTSAEELFDGRQRSDRALAIATRHHLHADLVVRALESGRHVFVEKPLCLNRGELARIDNAMASSTGSLLVGFNRRFAPASLELKRAIGQVTGPKVLSIRVMPGRLDPHHWYANYEESGGRIVGEACHFLDYLCFAIGSRPVRVLAQSLGRVAGRMPFPDSVAVQIEFEDGSSGQLIYSGEGDPSFPKESLTLFAPGLAAELVNFQEIVIHANRRRSRASHPGKGHAEEMKAWIEFLNGQRCEPIPYAESRTSMLLTFCVLDSLREGQAILVRDH